MWASDGAENTRVVAMLGPADVRPGSTALTRTIETIEGAGAGSGAAQSIRTRAEAATMQLELLPPYAGGSPSSTRIPAPDDRATEPTAAYTLSPLITIASYDACAGPGPFAVRYLRRGADGRIVRDEMLRRIPDAR